MEKFFHLKENGTTVSTEILAGITTFFAMAYIIVVNPQILSSTGMSWGGVFLATIIAAIIGWGLRFGYAGYGTFLRIRSNDERIAYGVGLGSGQRG